MKILCDHTLHQLPYAKEFHYTTYASQAELSQKIHQAKILICRSTLKITSQLLHNTHLKYIATASSGIDHIDLDLLTKHKITLLDAKGCNANSVANYVMACLAALQVIPTTVGIIGMGTVGNRVKQGLLTTGFNVYEYDPYLNLHDLVALKHCEIICIHANLHHNQPYPSDHLINDDFLNSCRAKIIINAA